MEGERLPRKLAAILYADVAGYSRLTGENEDSTHRRLAEYFDQIAISIDLHRGRVMHYAGDAVLAMFEAVVDAVSCAAQVQSELQTRNEELPDEQKVQFRIGVNMGDVIEDRGDIYGDGVNVAARLESLAAPGGICISESVHTAIGNKLPIDYEFIGEQQVKNITKPIKAYNVAVRPGSVLPPPYSSPIRRKSVVRTFTTFAIIALIVVFAVAVIWQSNKGASIDGPPLPEKSSIAVLPFANMSGDSAQQYFADGIADDLLTDLSKISALFVIGRNSSFAYKGKSQDLRTIGRELGVKYVMEGSVRRAGDQVRVNAQLIDASTGGHVWAERYDGSLADVFGLQDEIVKSIVSALSVKLTPEEAARRLERDTEDVHAYNAFLQGWDYFQRGTATDFAKAIPFFEEAVAIDPNYSRAHAALAAIYTDRAVNRFAGIWKMIVVGVTPEEARDRGQFHLVAAMKKPVPLAYVVSSRQLTYQGEYADAIAKAEQAIMLDPNDPIAYEALGIALTFSGNPKEGAGMINKAIRLDPRYKARYLPWLGLAQFEMSQFEKAADSLSLALEQNPEDDMSLMLQTASFAKLGRLEEAKRSIDSLNQIRSERKKQLTEGPDKGLKMGIDYLLIGDASLKELDFWPFGKSQDREKLSKALRLAGIPEGSKKTEVSPIEVSGAITVDALGAKKLFDARVPFVDVRGDSDWSNGHIPGAVHLDWKNAFTEAALLTVVAKSQKVVIHCQGPGCLRSSKACAKAVSWGFTNVYYFRDGFPGWKAAGFEVTVP